jgi:hypothetical protein
MTLIYAFQDDAGHWHGDLDTPLLGEEPARGTLTYRPVPGTPEASSPFAGQTLNVLLGVTDLDPGPVAYQLDSGGTFRASWHVHTLMAAPMGSQTVLSPPAHAPEPCLEMSLTDGGRRYILTATQHDDGSLAANLTVSTTAGEVQGELCGDIDLIHLDGMARLLGAAARAASVPAAAPAAGAAAQTVPGLQAPRRGEPWSDEENARLAGRYRNERDVAVLGQEFGRSLVATQHQLARLDLARRPALPRPATPGVLVPKSAQGPTLEERRKTHSRSHEKWTEEEEKQLALRCAQGAPAEEMSREFGRSEGGIEARLKAINAQGPAADKARMSDF